MYGREFFGNFLGFWDSLTILSEFFGNSLEILSEFFGDVWFGGSECVCVDYGWQRSEIWLNDMTRKTITRRVELECSRLKSIVFQKLFCLFTVPINCSSDLKKFANSQHSASNFKTFSQSLQHFFSHCRSEQFWKENTISRVVDLASLCSFSRSIVHKNFQLSISIKIKYMLLNCPQSFSRGIFRRKLSV